MDIKQKVALIRFIHSSRHGKVVAGGANLMKYSRSEIRDMVIETVKRIIAKSEIEADEIIGRSRSS
jgi:urease gamma subunit